MSFLVAMLLLNVDTPYNAFICLANMLNQHHFYSFFRMNTEEVCVQIDFMLTFKD